MAECAAIMSNSDFSPHERYLRLYRLVQDRNRDIAIAFDDMRRSTGIRHIASMISLDLLTRDELEGFTPQTLAAALDLKGLMRATKRPRRQKT
jgi:hypothetical protein